MVNRSDIGRRVRAKSLKKLMAKKRANPEDYIHEVTDDSRYLSMKYDFDRGILPPNKMDQYLAAKKEYEERKEKERLERIEREKKQEDEECESEFAEPNQSEKLQ